MMEQYIHSDLHFMEILIIPDKWVTVFNLQEVLLLLKRCSKWCLIFLEPSLEILLLLNLAWLLYCTFPGDRLCEFLQVK